VGSYILQQLVLMTLCTFVCGMFNRQAACVVDLHGLRKEAARIVSTWASVTFLFPGFFAFLSDPITFSLVYRHFVGSSLPNTVLNLLHTVPTARVYLRRSFNSCECNCNLSWRWRQHTPCLTCESPPLKPTGVDINWADCRRSLGSIW
jgi:hypothetical protein